MSTEAIIAAITAKVKADLQKHADALNKPLTADNAEKVAHLIKTVVLEAAAEGLKTYLQQNETKENTIVANGQKYQFNRVSNKELHTPFGKITLPRRLYQDKNGNSFVPLDHAWNMEKQFATIDVRESILFALSLMPASEAHQLLEKCATFNMAESSFKKIAEQMSTDLEDNIDNFLEVIRQEEDIPHEKAKVVAVSMDGANVLLHSICK